MSRIAQGRSSWKLFSYIIQVYICEAQCQVLTLAAGGRNAHSLSKDCLQASYSVRAVNARYLISAVAWHFHLSPQATYINRATAAANEAVPNFLDRGCCMVGTVDPYGP